MGTVYKAGEPLYRQVGRATGVARLERIWREVRKWARREGHKYEPSYGVVGVAPT